MVTLFELELIDKLIKVPHVSDIKLTENKHHGLIGIEIKNCPISYFIKVTKSFITIDIIKYENLYATCIHAKSISDIERTLNDIIMEW